MKYVEVLSFKEEQIFNLKKGTILLQEYNDRPYGLPIDKTINNFGKIVYKNNNGITFIRSLYNIFLSIKKNDFVVRSQKIKHNPNLSSYETSYYYAFAPEYNVIWIANVGTNDEQEYTKWLYENTRVPNIRKFIIGVDRIKADLGK